MAKRAPVGEKQFTALDKGLAADVMVGSPPTPTHEPVAEAARQPTPAPNLTAERLPTVGDTQSASDSPERVVDAPVALKTAEAAVRRPVIAKPSANASPEKLAREKRFLLTRAEDREIERCVDRIAEGLGGTPVKLSHVIRACLTIVRHAEANIIRRAQEAGELTRPANGDMVALGYFEHELAKVLSQAFHDAPSLQ